MNKIIILIALLLHSLASVPNDSTFILKSKKIAIDNIGNIYAVDNDVITKYFVNQQVKIFSIKTFGTLETIDVTNGLKILLYFKDFQRILFLDSQLSPNGDVIELSNLGLEQTSLVCISFNNGFWVYNQANNELLRFNQNLEISVRTGNLKRLLNIDLQPNFMIEHNSKLYLNNPSSGILVFDIYGAYIKTIPLTGLQNFQIQYPYIFFVKENKAQYFDINTFEIHEIASLDKNCTDIIFNGKNCYWHFPEYIKINNCIQ